MDIEAARLAAEAQRTPLPPGDEEFEATAAGVAGNGGGHNAGHDGRNEGLTSPSQRNPGPQLWGPGVWYPPPPPPQPPQKVKLPQFWHNDAAAWFNLAVSTFNRLGVHGSQLRYEHTLMALPPEILERVRGVLSAAATLQDPFKALRDRLVELLTPNILDQVNTILYAPELGGRRPSELMDSLLASLPPGEADGLLFKGVFLHRLPEDIRDQVAIKMKELPSRELAALADNLWFARNAKRSVRPTAAAAVTPDPGEDTVAAIPPANKKKSGGWRGRGGGRGRGGHRGGGRGGGSSGNSSSGGQTGGGEWLCFRHSKYGDGAYSCADPKNCGWSGNE